MEQRRTGRGFRIFGDEDIKCRHGVLRVQESSLAFAGAHAWLFYEEPGKENEQHPTPQINVAEAKKLIASLQQFVTEAEGDTLTEPVEWADEDEEEEDEEDNG